MSRSYRSPAVSWRLTELLRSPDRIHHRVRLVHTLLILGRWIGIGHNTGPSLKVSFAVFEHDRSNCDAAIVRTVESEISDEPAIKSAPRLLQISNQLHGSNLWRSRKCSRREGRPHRVKRIL